MGKKKNIGIGVAALAASASVIAIAARNYKKTEKKLRKSLQMIFKHKSIVIQKETRIRKTARESTIQMVIMRHLQDLKSQKAWMTNMHIL